MALTWDPIITWNWMVLISTISLLLLVSAAIARGRRAGNSPRQAVALLCEVLAVVALVLAAMNPSFADKPPVSIAHLAVILDVSESVLRTPEIWERAKRTAVALVEHNIAKSREDLLARGRSSVILFSSAVDGDDFPLSDLAAELARTPVGPLANGLGTDLNSALLDAGRRIAKTGRGTILLVTDGNDTASGVEEAALRLSQQGVPVWVIPISGGEPTLSVDLDLPRFTEAGVETALRGAIYHRGEAPINASLTYTRNTGIPEYVDLPFGQSLSQRTSSAWSLGQEQYAPLHRSLSFQGLGLQYVDVAVTTDSTLEQKRRLYTYVDRPVRLLAIGGDNTWMAGMPSDGVAIIERLPEDLTSSTDLSQFDGIVISSVPAERFGDGVLEILARAVEQGLGLMLLNGPHAGVTAETPTVLRSFADTPLDRVLPLTADPREAPESAPSRYVAIVMDASGSMEGWRIEKAKEIAAHVVQTLLNRTDTLDLIVFTTRAFRVVNDQPMTEANKPAALQDLDSFAAGGGTDPRDALSLVQTGKDCNLIFLSDGGFNRLSGRPDCKCIAFSIAGDAGPGSTLSDLCQEVYGVGPDFNPADIGFDMLKGETRSKFWEEGNYMPKVRDTQDVQDRPVQVPTLELMGSAIGYKKPDTVVAAYRPKLADPVLAYRAAGSGFAGTMVSSFPVEWTGTTEGRAAIQEWILRIVAYAERERYEFRVDDLGRILRLRISLLPENGQLPRVTGLKVRVELGEDHTDIPMTPMAGLPGVFTGDVDLTRNAEAQAAMLNIEETGPGRLPRAQRVPLLLPPEGKVVAGSNQEANTWGVNEGLLRDLTALTGGGYEPDVEAALLHSMASVQTDRDLWPLFALLAAWSYWMAILLRRLG